MEKRQSLRVECTISANIISGGRTCGGFIDNISEDGLEYLMTSVTDSTMDFIPERVVTLSIQTPSGRKLHLECEVRWYLDGTRENATLTMGMKILNPAFDYRKFIRELNSETTH